MKRISILLLVLSSCSPAWKLQRAKTLINLAKAEGAPVKADTIYKEKIVQIKGPETLITLVDRKDTTIYQDRIRLQYIHHHDTTFEYVKCPDSVIRIKTPIAVSETIVCPPENRWKWIAIGATGMFLCGLGMFFMTRK